MPVAYGGGKAKLCFPRLRLAALAGGTRRHLGCCSCDEHDQQMQQLQAVFSGSDVSGWPSDKELPPKCSHLQLLEVQQFLGFLPAVSFGCHCGMYAAHAMHDGQCCALHALQILLGSLSDATLLKKAARVECTANKEPAADVRVGGRPVYRLVGRPGAGILKQQKGHWRCPVCHIQRRVWQLQTRGHWQR